MGYRLSSPRCCCVKKHCPEAIAFPQDWGGDGAFRNRPKWPCGYVTGGLGTDGTNDSFSVNISAGGVWAPMSGNYNLPFGGFSDSQPFYIHEEVMSPACDWGCPAPNGPSPPNRVYRIILSLNGTVPNGHCQLSLSYARFNDVSLCIPTCTGFPKKQCAFPNQHLRQDPCCGSTAFSAIFRMFCDSGSWVRVSTSWDVIANVNNPNEILGARVRYPPPLGQPDINNCGTAADITSVTFHRSSDDC